MVALLTIWKADLSLVRQETDSAPGEPCQPSVWRASVFLHFSGSPTCTSCSSCCWISCLRWTRSARRWPCCHSSSCWASPPSRTPSRTTAATSQTSGWTTPPAASTPGEYTVAANFPIHVFTLIPLLCTRGTGEGQKRREGKERRKIREENK